MGMTQGFGWWRRLLHRREMERQLDAKLHFHFDGLVADDLGCLCVRADTLISIP